MNRTHSHSVKPSIEFPQKRIPGVKKELNSELLFHSDNLVRETRLTNKSGEFVRGSRFRIHYNSFVSSSTPKKILSKLHKNMFVCGFLVDRAWRETFNMLFDALQYILESKLTVDRAFVTLWNKLWLNTAYNNNSYYPLHIVSKQIFLHPKVTFL